MIIRRETSIMASNNPFEISVMGQVQDSDTLKAIFHRLSANSHSFSRYICEEIVYKNLIKGKVAASNGRRRKLILVIS